MTQETLESLGLSPNEAKIYESLIEKGESSVSDIALAAGVHRRNAYDAIERLIAKGLCFQIVSTGENLYNAVDPEKLTELLAEKQTELARILPDLKDKFTHRVTGEEAYIYRGLEGQKNVWRDILRVGKPVYDLGGKGGWYDPRLETSRLAFLKEAKRKGIDMYTLYDNEILADSDFIKKLDVEALHHHRFLPKNYSTGSMISVFGDYVVTYTGVRRGGLDDNIVFFVIKSTALAESHRTWYRYMWEHASERKSK